MSRSQRYYEGFVQELRNYTEFHQWELTNDVTDLLEKAADVIEFYQDREEAADC